MTTPLDRLDPALSLADGRAQVRFEQTWETDAADLWDAVTDPERLARWFAPIVGTPVVGGEFAVHFDDAEVPSMRLLSCEPGRGYTFAWPSEHGPTEVDVEVREETASASTLVLTHRLLTREQAPEYGAGWTAYLAQLRDHLAGRPVGDWDAAFGAARDRLRERVASLPG